MHFNDFDGQKEGVRRFYLTENADSTVIRAWQGHKVETKWFCPVSGSFLVGLVQIDNWERPSPDLLPKRLVLRAKEPLVLKIPPGYANGFRALEPASKMLIFSDKPFAEAEKVVFDQNLWMNWSHKESVNRKP